MTQSHKTNNLVIIPTYNEKENIESIIRYPKIRKQSQWQSQWQ